MQTKQSNLPHIILVCENKIKNICNCQKYGTNNYITRGIFSTQLMS